MAGHKKATEPAEVDLGPALDRAALDRVVTDQPLQAKDLRAAIRALAHEIQEMRDAGDQS